MPNDEPTVFVVDDDPAVLGSVAKLLEIMFPHVQTYPTAAEFLAAYHPSQRGCLVLDVAMPEMSGLELHDKLAQNEVSLPVVFMTGHGNVKMAVGAMQKGAVDFLEKPFRDQELWDSVRKALQADSDNRARHSRQAAIDQRMAALSRGERDVLDRILAGKPNREIATDLGLSIRTVEDRRARLMKKMQAGSVAELVQLATAD